jgi:hypothetical protein
MLDLAWEFFGRKWLEIITLVVAFGGLLYAHLSYRTSKRGLAQGAQAELNTLRIQAKAGLNDARQSQVALDLTCQIYRANWASHARKQGVTLSAPVGLHGHAPTDAVQFEGRKLLQQITASGENLDAMDLQALEMFLQHAKAASLNIQALAGKLASPP